MTTVSSQSAAAGSADDERKRRIAMARRATAAFGQIMALLLRSPAHQRMTVAEIQSVIAPIVMNGQYALAGRRFSENGFVRPIAAVLWVEVSEEVDQRLLSSKGLELRLKRVEISSGPIIWLIDVLGDGSTVEALLGKLRATVWRDRMVRARALRPDGSVEIKSLRDAAPVQATA